MGNRSINPQIKWLIIDMLEANTPMAEIKDAVKKRVSGKTVDRVIKTYVSTGQVTANTDLYNRRGRPRIVSQDQALLLKDIVERDPTLYLEELQVVLSVEQNIVLSMSSLERTLQRLNLTLKRCKRHATE